MRLLGSVVFIHRQVNYLSRSYLEAARFCSVYTYRYLEAARFCSVYTETGKLSVKELPGGCKVLKYLYIDK